MQARGAARRTGGRSARVRTVVHAAVTELLADPDAELTVGAVAARSGVHPTSVYRRWGTLEALVLDVAVTRISAASPMPDTGTLREDLLSYAHQAAHDLGQPDGLMFLRAVLTATPSSEPSGGPQPQPASDVTFLAARGAQIQAMLDRAATRGEPRLHYTDVLDVVLAPLYLRALFGVGGIDADYVDDLVERLLTVADSLTPRTRSRRTDQVTSPSADTTPHGLPAPTGPSTCPPAIIHETLPPPDLDRPDATL